MKSLQGLSVPVFRLVTEQRGRCLWSIGGEGGDLSREVISPCIRVQFKQTSVGGSDCEGKECTSCVRDSALCDLWLDCHRLTYDAVFTPCVLVTALGVSLERISSGCSLAEMITSRSNWVGIMKDVTIKHYPNALV